MEPSLETPADEVAPLRRSLDNLVSIMALPALWPEAEPLQIVGRLLDALREMLPVVFVFARLKDPEGGAPIEMVRLRSPAERAATAHDIAELLELSLGSAPSRWPPSARVSIGGADAFVATSPLGLHGEIGTLAAGFQGPDLPGQTETLLLDVAANQAAVGLQRAHLLGENRRVAGQLDERVARRTRELAVANEELAREVEERRRAEAAARDGEREARLIVDSIPGLVALMTATGKLEIVNRQLLEYFGRTLEELREWGTSDAVHPEDLPHAIESFTRSVTSGSPCLIVQRFRRSDGVYRWFENSGFPVHDAAGRITRWCVLLTDVDERKHAEEAIRTSERDLKLIIDTVPALVWSTGPDGAADFFNEHYLDFIGLSAEEARGWGWMVAIHPEDVDRLAATWRRMLNSEAPGEAEARMRRHDGEYRWFLFRADPLRDESGAIVKWYGVNTDIEDRKRGEAELRRAYDSFADTQRLSKTGSFITDVLGDEHNWSEETYRIFDFDPGTRITAQRIRDIIHPEDLPPLDAMVERAVSGGEVDFAFRITTARGAVKHVRGVAHLVEQIEGRPMFVGALHDVTETVVAEEALNRARSELAHLARVSTLGALTASIAHEVNQPLSGIITNASTCLRMLDADPPNVMGALETARRTIRDGHRASDVISRLRTLFSNRELVMEPTDLSQATQEVIALSLSELRRNRVVLQPELADDLPSATCDRIQLQQVILNLVRNASDAMAGVDDRPRRLLIRTEREDGEHIRVTVRDTGVGIDPENIDKLFDSFYTTKRGGMGIGLSVSRSIVEKHQGRLWVEPNEGPGATFAFAIPCHPGSGGESATA